WDTHPRYWSTVQFPDLDGDHRADVCGRSGNGLDCALSLGDRFDSRHPWSTAMADSPVWTDRTYYATIQFPDVNGDGKADTCARDPSGIVCGLSTGTEFGLVSRWSADFSDAQGWVTPYGESIQFPDIDGDGRADVCGRREDGLHCALSNGIDSFAP